MTTRAGEITNAAGNPQWVATDGKPYYALDPKQAAKRTTAGLPYSTGTRQDYLRHVGWQGRRRGLGPLGWIFCVPNGPGWWVSTADDSTEASLVPNVTTTTTALTASGQSVLPLTSATGFAAGQPITAVGVAAGSTIALVNGLNVTLSTPTTGAVASGANVTTTPPGPPTVGKPPAGTK